MLKETLFRVNSVIPEELESFRLKLRNIAKEKNSDIYFKKIPNDLGIKNFGCLLFGQPDVWKGIISIKYNGPVSLDIELETYRIFEEFKVSKEEIKNLLEKVLKDEYWEDRIYIEPIFKK